MHCSGGNWCSDVERVHSEGGLSYCLFHAPRGKKGITTEEFNRRIFERIDRTLRDEFRVCVLSGTIFEGDIDFGHYDHLDPLPSIDFTRSQFTFAAFAGVHFGGRAVFSEAQFSETGYFDDAIFNDQAYFDDVQFNGTAFFDRVQFSRRSFFQRSRFSGHASFRDSVFKASADFERARFEGIIRFTGLSFNTFASFDNIIVERSLTFIGVNLSRVDFFPVDISNIEFVDCRWKRRYGRNMLSDEIPIHPEQPSRARENENSGPQPSFKRILFSKMKWHVIQFLNDLRADRNRLSRLESLYSRFMNNARDFQRSHDVSDWHYGEKEMYRKKKRLRRFNPLGLTNLYWFSSGYGERPIRAGMVLLILLIIATVSLGFVGPNTIYGHNLARFRRCSEVFERPSHLSYLATVVIQYATFQKEAAVSPDSIYSAWLKILIQLLIPAQGTLFFLALRNRFRRFM